MRARVLVCLFVLRDMRLASDPNIAQAPDGFSRGQGLA